ncbi:MAG: NAD-dependent epimerase/dehydratase family protein [Planctomycetota bacterium]|jgi:UDP-glucose 4-epimerase
MPTHGDELAPIADAIRGQRVCITGGAGFVGVHLSHALIRLGAEVCIIDDLSSSDGTELDELFELADGRLDFVHGSILDPAALWDAVEGSHLIVHLAAVTTVGESMDNPRRTIDVNTAGTARVAEAARQANVRRVVFASSSSVYGDSPVPHREDIAARPLSPYAASKASGEHIVKAWASSMGVDGVSLRFFNIFGPNQKPGSRYAAVIPIFLDRASKNLPVQVHGDGNQTRDFISIQEVIRATLLALTNPEPLHGEAINVGTGKSVTINELAEVVKRVSGAEVPIEHAQARDGDVPQSVADMTKAFALLGFTPRGELEENLSKQLHAV